MKPRLEHLPLDKGESFVVKHFDYHFYPTPWHFHPEYEIVLVTESTGKRFIGDNISNFRENNLALIGPFLPHLYRNDAEYYQKRSKLRAKSIVVHFLESSFGSEFLKLPESRSIMRMLQKSGRGLEFYGRCNEVVKEMLYRLCDLKGFKRLLLLLEILQTLSETREYKLISRSTVEGQNHIESNRLDKIFSFVLNNYHREITIAEIAGELKMADNSFSRFFSQRTRKTFTSFVNEIRLNQSCKLLIENERSVAEICYATGFQNLSNFNRQFKKSYAVSPVEYRKQYLS